MKIKITPKVVAFVAVVAILAWFLYLADVEDARQKLALQRTQLVYSKCMYFDGFTDCQVAMKYCTPDGRIKPLSFGLCEELEPPNFNRAAIGDACDDDDDCEEDEYCGDDACRACTRDSHCPSATPLCYNWACVECEQDSDCATDEVCTQNDCIDAALEGETIGGECETYRDCADDEYCYEEICVDAENPTQWSTVEFNNTVIDEFRDDYDDITEDIEISKKWFWYGIFIAGILVSLSLLMPVKRRLV
jgi:hypothetical protein